MTNSNKPPTPSNTPNIVMSDGLIERLARALWEKQKAIMGPVWFHPSEKWEGIPYGAQNEWIELAKAAIAAMGSSCACPHHDKKQESQPRGHPVTPFDPNRHCDAQRVIAWIDAPDRKSANMAFTEGLERQIAYRFEDHLPREIPDVAISKMADYIWQKTQRGESGISRSMIADKIRETISPYLRTTEPSPYKDYTWEDVALLVQENRALKEQATMPVMSGWQPIESAPKDGTQILLGAYVNEELACMNDCWYQDRIMGGFDEWDEIYGVKPTHWMPLPGPPKQGDQ